MAKQREQQPPPLGGADLLDGENQAIQRLIGARPHTQLANVRIEDIDPNPFNPRQQIDVTELVESMRMAEREGKLRERVKFLSRYSLLIVDEIGYLPLSNTEASLFFRLVSRRYEHASLIVTCIFR